MKTERERDHNKVPPPKNKYEMIQMMKRKRLWANRNGRHRHVRIVASCQKIVKEYFLI